MAEAKQAERDVLDEIVARIVEAVDPDKIILFGSRARGDGSEHSDYDILIVSDTPLPKLDRTGPLYGILAGVGAPKDVVWWTPDEVAEWQLVKRHFITTAVREGRVIYERPH